MVARAHLPLPGLLAQHRVHVRRVQVENVPDKHLLPPGQAVCEVSPVNVVVWIKFCVGVRVAFGHHGQQDDGVDDQVKVGGDEENQLAGGID